MPAPQRHETARINSTRLGASRPSSTPSFKVRLMMKLAPTSGNRNSLLEVLQMRISESPNRVCSRKSQNRTVTPTRATAAWNLPPLIRLLSASCATHTPKRARRVGTQTSREAMTSGATTVGDRYCQRFKLQAYSRPGSLPICARMSMSHITMSVMFRRRWPAAKGGTFKSRRPADSGCRWFGSPPRRSVCLHVSRPSTSRSRVSSPSFTSPRVS